MTASENGQIITKDILCTRSKNGIHVYWGRGGKSCGLSQHLGHADTRLKLHLGTWAPNEKYRYNKTKLANQIQATVKELWAAEFAANNQDTERESTEDVHIKEFKCIMGIEDYNGTDVVSPAPLSPSQGDEDGEMRPDSVSLDDTEQMAAREAQLRDKEDKLYSILYMAMNLHANCVEGIIELFEYSELEDRVGLLGEVYTVVDVDKTQKLNPDQTLPQPLQSQLAHLRTVRFLGVFAWTLVNVLDLKCNEITNKRFFLDRKERTTGAWSRLVQPFKIRLLDKMLKQAAIETLSQLEPFAKRLEQEWEGFREGPEEGAVTFIMHSEDGVEVPRERWNSALTSEYRLQIEKIGAQLNLLRDASNTLEDIGGVEQGWLSSTFLFDELLNL
ncbi:hypothetical protein SLS58_003443 [Diplodia intermedia]|uniref:Uncharacterized protein n=1 Tax=Diplodia intermedia TaxID=856260 RepID=A0ABR3TW41_9PEZI